MPHVLITKQEARQVAAKAAQVDPEQALKRFLTLAKAFKAKPDSMGFLYDGAFVRGMIEAAAYIEADQRRRQNAAKSAGRKRRTDVPRCACGRETLARAKARGHRCERQPDERDAKAASP